MTISSWFEAGKVPLLVLAALTAGSVAADEGGAEARAGDNTAPRCRAPEYRAFDFWIGNWDVRNPRANWSGTTRSGGSPAVVACSRTGAVSKVSTDMRRSLAAAADD